MSETKLKKSDLLKNFWRINLFPMTTINYERFQSLQYAFAMIPIIKKLYPDNKEEQAAAAERHMEFYNTTPNMINWTMGLNVAQEEQIANMEQGEERDQMIESVSTVKASLMGPLAGVGDSMKATQKAIFSSIAAGLAASGTIFGALFFLLVENLYEFGTGYLFYKTSYVNGTQAITDLNQSGLLNRVLESATILGLTSLGALVPAWIGFSLDKDFDIQGVIINLQTELDNIFPGLIPLGLTLLLAYFYRKRVSPIKLVGLIFVLALLFTILGFG